MNKEGQKRLSVNLSDEQCTQLDYVCKARHITRTELIHKFIATQYELVQEDSQVHQTISKIEELTKELEELSKNYKPTV